MKSLRWILLVWFFVLIAVPAFATDRYVDNGSTGCSTPSDTDYDPATRACGSGSSLVYNTPQAASNVAVAGDTVYFRTGTYAGFSVTNSGTAGNVIMFKNYSGEAVTLSAGSGVASCLESNVLVCVNSRSYITVDGLKGVGNSSTAGIIEVSNSNNIQILNCEATGGTGGGVSFFWNSYTNVMRGCKIYNNSTNNADRLGLVTWGGGSFIHFPTSNITIEDNYIYWNHGEGLLISGSGHTVRGNVIADNWSINLYLGRQASNTLVEHNLIYVTDDAKNFTAHDKNNPPGIFLTNELGEADVDIHDATIRNNIIVKGDWCIRTWFERSGSLYNINVYNNTCVKTRSGIKLSDGNSQTGLQVRNNVIMNDGSYGYPDNAFVNISPVPSSSTISNNIYNNSELRWIYGDTTYTDYASWATASGDSNSGTDDPLLSDNTHIPCRLWDDPGLGDGCATSALTGTEYSITASSPALNTGVNVALPCNGTCSRGAFDPIVFADGEVGTVDSTTAVLNWSNSEFPPILPASSCTGFTFRADASPITVNACARNGTNQIRLTLASAPTGGQALDFSYSAGNVTTSGIGNDHKRQTLFSITNQAVVNNVGGSPSHLWVQTYSRFHGLRGTEAAPVVKGSTSGNWTIQPNGAVRIRLKIACTTADCPSTALNIRYSRNAGAYTIIPDTAGADKIQMLGTGSEQDVPATGTSTTELLTSDHATNVACAVVRTSNAVPNLDLSLNSETECEWVVKLLNGTTTDTYDFRAYHNDGSVINTYNVTPRLTVVNAAMSF